MDAIQSFFRHNDLHCLHFRQSLSTQLAKSNTTASASLDLAIAFLSGTHPVGSRCLNFQSFGWPGPAIIDLPKGAIPVSSKPHVERSLFHWFSKTYLSPFCCAVSTLYETTVKYRFGPLQVFLIEFSF
ncbi:uncharacterized protein LDX57_002552 [Aspergillus melleus]|uniref:uncharacterized protein n=1 Tax=Aspergillus melleus TaxID=138277 RepID=UPI001E8CFA6A|nr:uncharacterized protein LDX57_002552 [Aspergillus melleus]KAH8424809.1 hypothetical protein LDX57_002552 [Aspergillus melleus]